MPVRASQQSDTDSADKIRRAGSDEIIVPAAVAQKMGLQVIAVAERVRPLQISPLQGVLAVDSEHLSRVRSRFTGEVVSIGPEQPANGSAGLLVPAPRVGDAIRKGDLLAVVLSKDLGEKKSELVDLPRSSERMRPSYFDFAMVRPMEAFRLARCGMRSEPSRPIEWPLLAPNELSAPGD